MDETPILKALQTAALAAYDASALSAALGPQTERIKAILRTFTAPNDGKYFEFVNIPNNRSGDYYGDERIYQGLFRVILHWPNMNEGAYEPMTMLDQYASYFKKQKTFLEAGISVKIYGEPQASGVITGGSELLFPVGLPYRCFVA